MTESDLSRSSEEPSQKTTQISFHSSQTVMPKQWRSTASEGSFGVFRQTTVLAVRGLHRWNDISRKKNLDKLAINTRTGFETLQIKFEDRCLNIFFFNKIQI